MNRSAMLAGVLGATTVAIAVAGLWLSWLTRSTPVPPEMDLANPVLFPGWLAFTAVGVLLATQRSSNAIGWLLLAVALLWQLHGLTGVYRIAALLENPGWPGGAWAAWAWDWTWAPGILAVFLVPLYFPTGRLPSRRWLPVTVALVVGAALVALSVALRSGPLPNTPMLLNPAAIEGSASFFEGLEAAGNLLFVVGVLGALAVPAIRYRRAGPIERHQLKWFAVAVVLVFVTWVAAEVLQAAGARPTVLEALRLLPLIAFPVAIGIAIRQYRLYDIDVVLHRSIIYGTLAAGIGVLYLVVVAGLGSAAGVSSGGRVWLSVLATALAAVAFAPLRIRLDRVASRIVYGERLTPYEGLRSVIVGSTGSSADAGALMEIARTVVQAASASSSEVWVRLGSELRLGAMWPDDTEPAVTSMALPQPEDHPAELDTGARLYPVHRHGRVLGAITVTFPRGETLSAAGDALLRDIASAAWLILDHAQLAGELRASHQRLVTAQDAERRRVERDLHDGAQQRLLELALTLGRAREEATRRDHEHTVTALDEAGQQLRTAITELRDLARGIYPEILGSRGLVPALESLAERAPLPVVIEATGARRDDPRAESTAYFVAAEALTNVIKHAHATQVIVTVEQDQHSLRLSVADDGVGGADPDGTGLRGLSDRVAALGGTVQVSSVPDRGTCIRIELPCESH